MQWWNCHFGRKTEKKTTSLCTFKNCLKFTKFSKIPSLSMFVNSQHKLCRPIVLLILLSFSTCSEGKYEIFIKYQISNIKYFQNILTKIIISFIIIIIIIIIIIFIVFFFFSFFFCRELSVKFFYILHGFTNNLKYQKQLHHRPQS